MQGKLLLVALSLATITILFYAPAFAGGGGAGAASNVRESCDLDMCHIKMVNSTFTPDTLIVRPDAAVVWENMDDVRHTITSGSPDNIQMPLNSDLIENGKAYEFVFSRAEQHTGKFVYFCQVHPLMRGEIIVQGEPIPEFPQVAMIVAAGLLASMIALMQFRKNVFRIR
ncbi:MAG: cupredoxin domain-containing protein [Nitrososphaerales archaeon]